MPREQAESAKYDIHKIFLEHFYDRDSFVDGNIFNNPGSSCGGFIGRSTLGPGHIEIEMSSSRPDLFFGCVVSDFEFYYRLKPWKTKFIFDSMDSHN